MGHPNENMALATAALSELLNQALLDPTPDAARDAKIKAAKTQIARLTAEKAAEVKLKEEQAKAQPVKARPEKQERYDKVDRVRKPRNEERK